MYVSKEIHIQKLFLFKKNYIMQNQIYSYTNRNTRFDTCNLKNLTHIY